MKATSEAIIKIKALKMWVPDNIGCRCSVVKKEGICCAAVKDRKCRLCSANLKMKGNLNFKLHGRGLWVPVLVLERCTFEHSLQHIRDDIRKKKIV